MDKWLTSVIGVFFLATCSAVAQEIDPTTPLPKPSAATSYLSANDEPVKEYQLQGTAISNGARFALISGQVVQQGGSYKNMKLVEVAEAKALLAKRKERRVLMVGE